MKIIKNIENGIVLENGELLGLNIGLSNRGTAGTEFSDIRKKPGYILKSSGVETFTLPEITEINDEILIYSNDINCGLKPLYSSDNDLETITEIVQFFSLLKERGYETSYFASNLLYKTDDDQLLMMPPSIIAYINERETLAKKLSNLSIYSHPDLKGERALLFSIGVILFEHTTDNYPIDYNDVENLRDKMRRKRFFKPVWKNIRLNSEICSLIETLLDADRDISLEETYSKLKKLTTEGIYRTDINLEQEQPIYTRKENNLLRSEKQRALFIKHKGTLIGVGIAVLVLMGFFGTMISNALKPPATSGFSQQQVVESYFTAFKTLDPQLIDDVLAKGIRKGDSTEISTLFVTLKMRTQSDPTAVLLSPKEWLTLPDDKKANSDVYGMHNLTIEPIGKDKFSVKYEKWFTQPADSLADVYVMEVYRMIKDEIFTMTETKYSYEVSDITTVSDRSEQVW